MATIAIGISPKAGGNATADVPINALEEGGTPPEEGDSVSFSVEGKVQSISGSTATISIDSINGEPVGEEGSESSEEEAGEEGQQGGGGGPPTSGASPRTGLDALGPMNAGLAGAGLGGPTARSRLDRTGTNLMRQRLMKGARGRPLPF